MRFPLGQRRCLAGLLVVACASLNAAELDHPDHFEFDATVSAAFASSNGRWPIVVHFNYPGAGHRTQAAWRLDAIAPDGKTVKTWRGITLLAGQHRRIPIVWNGRDAAGRNVLPGYYTLRLRAVPTIWVAADAGKSLARRIGEAYATFPEEMEEQKYDVMVGHVAPARMPVFRGLRVGAQRISRASASTRPGAGKASGTSQSVAATGSLPYTIYYGNLHSQTNHSDGGAPVATCSGASAPQTGAYGPSDAFAMMQTQAGGDFLLTSEHNHMYDGSTGTNSSALPANAINLFHSGLQAATDYRATHPSFVPLYGLEWGVISNGGHLNLINPDALAEWEYNASNQLIGEVYTPKSDYPALYLTMKQRGWIGQFNHAKTSGQFLVNGTPLGYDANGTQVMVLAEVLNSSAFSNNTTETETGRYSYVGAWNILLERGYHVAPSSDQDNHCANWGLSFTNRTGVLLPSGTVFDRTAFLDGLRARRVFATEDKAGQLVLTANGHVMGESFSNSGPLTLTANFANSTGQTAQRIQFFEGVPGRNGMVTQLSEGSGGYTLTPAAGEHFYYALVTQADGLRLWSAPIWISQGSSTTDSTAPTVSASESGSSGTITLSATASDNVGVTNVGFYVDGTLKGNDATSPYAMSLDSTTLANGSHDLVAKAQDAAGNTGASAAVAFSIDNTASPTELVANGDFESGKTGWSASNRVISKSRTYPTHGGSWLAWLDGNGKDTTDYLSQTVSIPGNATGATLQFWLRVDSDETAASPYDTLKVQVRDGSGRVLATLATFSNLDKGATYALRSFDLTSYKGQTVQLYFEGIENAKLATSFLVDDVSLISQ